MGPSEAASIVWSSVEVVSKPAHGLNPRVGLRSSILKIRYVFLRLNSTRRLDLKPN
jgi:hypothetical protein